MSRIAVTGATGLIGSAVVSALAQRGDTVVVLSRNPELATERLGADVEAFGWSDPAHGSPPSDALSGADAVVHLLGEPISQRWSEQVKRRIRESRLLATRNLVAEIEGLPLAKRPGVLVSQSATGYYGPRGEEELDETAAPGHGFLASVVKEWEAEARVAERASLRVAVTRTGVVLTARGGALPKMLPPFKAGVGGPVAGGRQYLPWVHLDDVVGAILFAVDNDSARGPLNVTAPAPVTNKVFSKALGHVLRRPAVLPVPGLAVKLLFGEMAEIVLTGQRAVPRRLQELDYKFRQPDLEPALADALRN